MDVCPDTPAGKYPDGKRPGCPLASKLGTQIEIFSPVLFKTDSAEILTGKESTDVLDAVAKLLKESPEIVLVRVEGHTDDKASDPHNMQLSKRRAASVVAALVSRGINAKRLRSEGLGKSKPIAPNDTEEGRAKNRRVEFHIVRSEASVVPK